MRFAAPGSFRQDESPPVATDIAPWSGVAVRISAQKRTMITPRIWPEHLPYGISPSHPYVLTYWTAALGSPTLAELLRLIVAAKRGREVLHPMHLSVLCEEGLVHFFDRSIWVRPLLPPLGRRQISRLDPRIQQRHPYDLRWAYRPLITESPNTTGAVAWEENTPTH